MLIVLLISYSVRSLIFIFPDTVKCNAPMAIVVETDVVSQSKAKEKKRQQKRQKQPASLLDEQQTWEQSLAIEKRMEGQTVVVYANGHDGVKRKVRVHDRPGGYYALSYTDDESSITYATRVTGRYLDTIPINEYNGPLIDWREYRESSREDTARRGR